MRFDEGLSRFLLDDTEIEMVRTLCQSLAADDDTGNALIGLTIDADEYLGFRIEKIKQAPVANAPFLVLASRRAVAGSLLERMIELA